MSDSGDRTTRPGGKPDGARSDQSGPRRGQPASGGPRRDGGPSRRPDSTKAGSGDRGGVDRSAGNPFQTQRGGRDTEWEDRDPYGIKAVRNRHDDPEIPDDVKAGDLDRGARTQLKTLSKENAEEVARHRAMAAAHEAAAKCLESGKPNDQCQRELQAACKGLAIGKYCGMRHEH